MKLEELGIALHGFTAPNVFNPWRDTDPLDVSQKHAPQYRRERLYKHFSCVPRFLLIGEAPGYQGCHFSGVPFTNEKLILDGAIPRVSAADQHITRRDNPWSEPSATIVWRTLHELGIAERTVMWNAFAFHPHKPDEPLSNRAPTKQEIGAGAPYLYAVLSHFHGAKVVAVGKVAAAAIKAAGVNGDIASVRHPSMGGATQFRLGMERLVA